MDDLLAIILKDTYTLSSAKRRIKVLKSEISKKFFGGVEGEVEDSDLKWLNSLPAELFDKFGAVRLAYIQKDDNFPEVPPFTIQDYTLEFPIDLHLGIGDYWGSVNLIKGEKVIATQRTVFKVLEAGSLTPGFFKLIFNHIKLNQQYYGGAVLLGLLIFLIYSRKPRKFFLKKLFRLG